MGEGSAPTRLGRRTCPCIRLGYASERAYRQAGWNSTFFREVHHDSTPSSPIRSWNPTDELTFAQTFDGAENRRLDDGRRWNSRWLLHPQHVSAVPSTVPWLSDVPGPTATGLRHAHRCCSSRCGSPRRNAARNRPHDWPTAGLLPADPRGLSSLSFLCRCTARLWAARRRPSALVALEDDAALDRDRIAAH